MGKPRLSRQFRQSEFGQAVLNIFASGFVSSNNRRRRDAKAPGISFLRDTASNQHAPKECDSV
jgi:hypothetical protein